ncbi:MAG: SMC-Scp complex subunit ScpB [Clostridiales bacterium]|jgi:segregation and condensation protein B|nr:SMC-Scp complex subunit ScpB [Clostridiales bacterium]
MDERVCALEAVLFALGEPVSLDDICVALGVAKPEAREVLGSLRQSYEENGRGIVIREVNGKHQLSTNPAYHDSVRKLVQTPQNRQLTAPQLETLAIIAYKQPTTKAAIEEIRGVNADHCVNKLLEYNLICERGRLDVPGKPIVFGTTDEFARHFGFGSLKDMPALPEVSLDEKEAELESPKD